MTIEQFDAEINAGVDAFEAAVRAAGKAWESKCDELAPKAEHLPQHLVVATLTQAMKRMEGLAP